MHEPAVPGRAVPVLDPGGDVDNVALVQFACGLAPLLIPAAPGGAEQYLPAAADGLMDMPVVAAPRFEGHVADDDPFGGKHVQITVADKIPGIGRVGTAPGERSPVFLHGHSLLLIVMPGRYGRTCGQAPHHPDRRSSAVPPSLPSCHQGYGSRSGTALLGRQAAFPPARLPVHAVCPRAPLVTSSLPAVFSLHWIGSPNRRSSWHPQPCPSKKISLPP